MKKFIILLFTLFIVATTNAQIQSTSQGGDWFDKNTWVGEKVPTENDDVVITSTVLFGAGYYARPKCKSLTINNGAKFIRDENRKGGVFLTAKGNVVNNGAVIETADFFDIHVYGNFVNNGTFKIRTLEFHGADSHISGTKTIEASRMDISTDVLKAASNLHFHNCQVKGDTLDMGNYTLKASADKISFDSYWYIVWSKAYIYAPIKLAEKGLVILDKALLQGKVEGNLTIKSPSYAFLATSEIKGSLTIEKNTKLITTRTNKIHIRGDFYNYGEPLHADTVRCGDIKFYPGEVLLYCHGNIYNPLKSGHTAKFLPITDGKTITVEGNFEGDMETLQSENSNEKPGGKVIFKNEVNVYRRLAINTDTEVNKGNRLNSWSKWDEIWIKDKNVSLKNEGTIHQNYKRRASWGYRPFTGKDVSFVDFDLDPWVSKIDYVGVTVFNNQTYPGLPGSTKRWWRLEPHGENLSYRHGAKFYYDENLLNGQDESKLKLYRSTDKGKTWEMVSYGENAELNTEENYIAVGNWSNRKGYLTEFGDFVISSGDGSVPIETKIAVNLTGRKTMRIGAPNYFDVTMYNLTDLRSSDFLLSLNVGDEVRIDSVAIPNKNGVEVLPIDSIGNPEDKSVVFYVPYLDGSEEYTMKLICSALPNKSAKNSTVITAVAVWVGAYVAAEVGDRVTSYILNKVNERYQLNEVEQKQYSKATGVAIEKLKMKKETEGKGAYALKSVGKFTLTKLLEAVPGGKVIVKVGNAVENVSKVSTTLRHRLFYWLYKESGLIKDDVKVTGGKIIEGRKVRSFDPNQKVGIAGYGDKNYISSAGRMTYRIDFENKKEATAPAYRVRITDVLPDVFDVESVRFGTTSHNDSTKYKWEMKRVGNTLTWDIKGIELPPNVTPPQGEGYVTFSVKVKDGLESGTSIQNKATIIFDENEPIITNVWENVLDTQPPVLTMQPIVYNNGDSIVNVSCSVNDGENGSGVRDIKFYASQNDQMFKLIGESFDNSISFAISDSTKENFRFYAIATDNVGNQMKVIPEYALLKTIPLSAEKLTTSQLQVYPNPIQNYIYIKGFSAVGNTKIRLYDITGKLLLMRKVTNETEKINTQHLVKGVYMILIEGEDNATIKVVKQ